MKCYANLSQLKDPGWLGISSTVNDSILLVMLDAATREMDNLTHRWYECREETRIFDGAHSYLGSTYLGMTKGNAIFVDDILSVSSIGLDQDGSQNYSTSLATSDYLLYPLNGYPKYWIVPTHRSALSIFAENIRAGAKIAGVFGYGDGLSATPYTDSGGALTVANGTSKSITANDGTLFSVGQTLRCENDTSGFEQMFISAITGNTLTVDRGVNGTTAAAHTAKETHIYQYPSPIVEGTLIQASRWWKRKDTAFQNVVGSTELGSFLVYKGLDDDVKWLIQPFIKRIPFR